MSLGWFATLAAGVFGVIGAVAMFIGVASEGERGRGRIFRIGSLALSTAGLVLAFGSFVGWLGENEFFGGLLLILFGSGATLAPKKKKTPDQSTT